MITKKRRSWGLILFSILLILFTSNGCIKEKPDKRIPNVSSKSIKPTTIVPTLDSPIPPSTNVIWCSSFQYAWNELKNDVMKEDVIVAGAEHITDLLNNAKQSLADMDEGFCYANAGIVSEGVIDAIQSDMKRLFPSETPPQFGSVPPDSIAAYAFLTANVKFTLPYFENDEGIVFTDSSEKQTAVTSFGIREKDDYAYFQLRKQVEVLFGGWGLDEYAIDLCKDSQPNQIIVAVIKPEETLDLTVKSLEKRILDFSKKEKLFRNFGPNDVLLVPNILFEISHHFQELEGKTIINEAFQGYPISEATQMIQFKLDRSGAELKSESKVMMFPSPTYYVFDRSFLVYMKKRGAEHPFFVMWVDNAELLDKF